MSDKTHVPGNTPKDAPGPSPRIPPATTPRDTCRDPAAACGCCAGTEPITPESTANRPGLSALTYRIGTHSTFLETMRARLSSHSLGETRPLAALATRDDDDASIAMLDAWATVGDVLTFYQQNIANEGYLRTATERRSVLELARLVGYAPRPGVAASTYLAYTIDDNTEEEVVIPAGARVQSVPGPDELPQSFETSEDLRARAAWNELGARQTAPQQWSSIWDTATKLHNLYLKGIATNLKVDDPLLVVQRNPGDTPDDPSGERRLCRVTAVEPLPDPDGDPEADRTRVEIALCKAVGAGEKSKSAPGIIEDLIRSAPGGKTAREVGDHLKALRDLTATGSAMDVQRFVEEKTLPLLEARLETTGAQASKLRPWLEGAAQAMRAVLGSTTGGAKAADTSEAVSASRLNELITKPSKPLPNSLQLPRSLEKSFGATSDAGLKALGLASPDLRESLGAALESYTGASPEPDFEVYALRLKAGVFGRNAPKRTKTVRSGDGLVTDIVGEWPMIVQQDKKWNLETESVDTVFLDGNYDGILPGSWVVLDSTAVPKSKDGAVSVRPAAFEAGKRFLITHANAVATKIARAEYGIAGDSVRIKLDAEWIAFSDPEFDPPRAIAAAAKTGDPYQTVYDNDFRLIRGTVVYTQSERLELAEAPIETPVCDGASEGEPLELDGLYQDLEPGRFVIVSGERSDIAETSGVLATEAVMIAEVIHDVRAADAAMPLSDSENDGALPGDRIHTFVRFDKPLSYCYNRESLTIHGNVVKATHGETCNETLGGGDGSKALQSFTLKQSPLTYLAAPTAVGAESTLQAFVNDVRWHEQSSFVGLKPADHAFITKTDDDGKTTVTFGNGREGARLPTGIENVKAVYRFGIGKPGNVRAGQISLLSTRPQGVKEVINPLRASGGADRETRDQARRSAPLAVMSLDRLVSTPDYADFARSFAGIAKADAAELSDGRRTVVHVTIAGTDDIPIDPGSDLFINLRHALIDLGDPFQPVQIATRDLLLLVISAGVRIDPDYRWESVVTELRAGLLDAFGFEKRELAQDVTASEVLSVMQPVPGVVYVDLDSFGAVPSTAADSEAEEGFRPLTPDETATAISDIVAEKLVPRVVARSARVDAAGILPAQLAVLVPEVPDTLILNQIED
jgi:hypothetical protein